MLKTFLNANETCKKQQIFWNASNELILMYIMHFDLANLVSDLKWEMIRILSCLVQINDFFPEIQCDIFSYLSLLMTAINESMNDQKLSEEQNSWFGHDPVAINVICHDNLMPHWVLCSWNVNHQSMSKISF